ncbi:MAG TPA: glycoside hydrolase family 2 TIM barrel-domain containing protein [Pseudonocardiaceae bacterium]|nr:glycoside hydrolase family 2 TIM barrel-domain containing protein [Pseudonocardiaceae bacterium]
MDGEERGRPAGLSRRRFLVAVGIGAIGTATLGATFFGSAEEQDSAVPTDQWLFGRYTAGCTAVEFTDAGLTPVTVPHCVTPLSWQGWQPPSWESLWVYRQYFDSTPALRRGRAFLTFDGVLSAASVYLNDKLLGTHEGGYLPFEFELTGKLNPQSNVLAVVVDGRWNQDVPPDLTTFAKPSAIDFYQPAGMYRATAVTTTPKAYVSDVFASPVDVLTPDRALGVRATVDSAGAVNSPVRLQVSVSQAGMMLAEESIEVTGLTNGANTIELSVNGLAGVALWDVDNPQLCDVAAGLWIDGKQVHEYALRIGFRDAKFTADGFFLNGRRLKLFGLNRHQWYPYVGGAMPERMQRADAVLLKNELNCNMVRCSHYPQSTAFLDACDELGLLVWEEVPGWDYIGDSVWQQRVVEDVRGMVTRDRNHPSIIVWGTRINETLGQADLYDRTDQLAMELDGSRPTTGAVKGILGYQSPLYGQPKAPDSHPGVTDAAEETGTGTAATGAESGTGTATGAENGAGNGNDTATGAGNGSESASVSAGPSVFAFNDYSRPQGGAAELAPLRPPRPEVAYLVSEAVGTLVGPPTYRRTDSVAVQAEQAMLHASVHDQAAGDDRYCGLLGWCAFDYPSGWYHSADGVKYPGVADIFRIPKLGAAFYQSQADPSRRIVIEPGFYWDFGPGMPRNGPGRRSVIWSNCDRIDVFLDNKKLATLKPDRSLFPHLDHPPFLVNLSLPPTRRPELRLDGYLAGNLVQSRRFSPDRSQDVLSCTADDRVLAADGVDTTRIVVRVLDRYGAPRPYVDGAVQLAVSGPGTLIGDNPLDLAAAGGAAAVWVRTQRGQRGPITVVASHPIVGTDGAQVTAQ